MLTGSNGLGMYICAVITVMSKCGGIGMIEQTDMVAKLQGSSASVSHSVGHKILYNQMFFEKFLIEISTGQ